VADDEVVPDGDLFHGNLLHEPAQPHVGHPGSARNQSLELAPGTAGGRVLERVATGQHETDDRSREVFAEGQGRRHGNQSDCVDADVAVKQTPPH
jgi:hypothetical protein